MDILKDIKVEELSQRNVAYVSFVGNYMGNTEIFRELFGKLGAWAGPKGLMNENTSFLSSYKDDPNVTKPEDMTLEVCMEVSEDVKGEGEVETKSLPGGNYVVLEVELEASEYGEAWNKVVEWSKENGKEVDMSRPSYEFYLNNPDEHPQKHHIVKVCLSVK